MLYTPQSSPGRPPLPVDIHTHQSPSSPLPSPVFASVQSDDTDSREILTTRVFYETTNVQPRGLAAQRRASDFFSRKTDISGSGSNPLPTPPRSAESGLHHEEDEDDGAQPPAKKRRRDRVEHEDNLLQTDDERDIFHADDEEIRDTKLYHAACILSSSPLTPSSSFSSSSGATVAAKPARAGGAGLGVPTAVGAFRRAMMMNLPRFVNGSIRRYITACEANPLLTSLVSCNKTDLYRFHTPDYREGSLMNAIDSGTYCVPFIGVYSHAAKRGRGHVIAVATQEGTVEIIDTRPRPLFSSEPQRDSILAHENAVFDVQWSQDDTLLATSAGDHTSAIYHVESKALIATLRAHSLSVKTTLWHPQHPDLLMSCSRDGDIYAWDLRERCQRTNAASKPIFSIPQAHNDGLSDRRKSRVLRSVTSINFLPNRENLLLSSGSADGILKTWDVRYTTPTGRRRKTGTTGIVKRPFDESRDLTALTVEETAAGDVRVAQGRSRAIADVVVHPTGSVAWGLGKNGSIYTYHLDSFGWFTGGANPCLPSSANNSGLDNLSAYLPKVLSHHSLKLDTFYPRLAISSCGNFLAAGSSTGNVLLWDAESVLRPAATEAAKAPVALGGASAETSGVDWGYDSLVSCSDDYSVRVWRRDPQQAQECREHERRDGQKLFGAWGYPVLNP